MKRNLSAFLILLVVVFATACRDKSKETEPKTAEKVLVANPWKLRSIKDLQGVDIPLNQLNFQTQAIYEMSIEFQSNKIVKAYDEARQASNGGVWSLTDGDKVLDISITGFSGKFGVTELSSSKMSLKNNVPVSGANKEVIMYFEPVVK